MLTVQRLRLAINFRTLIGEQLRGWSRYTINLLEALLTYDVDYFLFSDRPLADRWLARLPRDRYHVAIERRSRYFLWEQRALPHLCREHRIDLLHCPTNYGLPAFSPCPTVLTLHDAIAEKYYRPRMRWQDKLRPASLLWNLSGSISRRSANRVITVSEHARTDLIDFFRLPREKIRVIHEAADPLFDRGPTDEVVQKVMTRYDISRPYLLYIGGWEERKNPHFLIRAFEKAHTNIALVMGGGSAEELADMRKRYARLDGRIRFIGWVEEQDLPALYSGARAFIYPSKHEGFGLQVCEAMQLGCPVFTSNAASLPEVLGAGGEAFSLADDTQLIHLIERVATDEGFFEDLKARSRKRATDFSWHKTAAATWEVYQDALQARPRRRW